MTDKPLCILVTGDPVPPTRHRAGGFANLIRNGLAGVYRGAIAEVDAREEQALPDSAHFSALIVTGSAASVTERAPWMLRVEQYLAAAVAADRPVLGICFGHQLLGQALGGLVERNPRGREMGTVELSLAAEDPLLDAEPTPALVQTTHVDSVTRLPPGARVLARTELEPHAALRFAARAWGVQFHPEFDATVMREYIEVRREILQTEGRDPDALLAGVRPAQAGSRLLARFLSLVLGPGSLEASAAGQGP